MELLKSEMGDKGAYELLKAEMERAATDYTNRIAKLNSEISEMQESE